LKIEYLDIKDITPYPSNARMHHSDDVEKIENSIREFGFNDATETMRMIGRTSNKRK